MPTAGILTTLDRLCQCRRVLQSCHCLICKWSARAWGSIFRLPAGLFARSQLFLELNLGNICVSIDSDSHPSWTLEQATNHAKGARDCCKFRTWTYTAAMMHSSCTFIANYLQEWVEEWRSAKEGKEFTKKYYNVRNCGKCDKESSAQCEPSYLALGQMLTIGPDHLTVYSDLLC